MTFVVALVALYVKLLARSMHVCINGCTKWSSCSRRPQHGLSQYAAAVSTGSPDGRPLVAPFAKEACAGMTYSGLSDAGTDAMLAKDSSMRRDEPCDADLFRRLWRGLGSTVTLIATEHAGERHAMLATAVTSVSMDPPSLLVCINRSASAHGALMARGAFSLGILGAEAQSLGAAIGSAAAAGRFAVGTWAAHEATGQSVDRLPWLVEAQASLFCLSDTCVEYGSHTVLIARVIAGVCAGGIDPLLYCDGRYGRFGNIVQ